MNATSESRVRLRAFTGEGYDKGRSAAWQVLWFATLHILFRKWWFPPKLRPMLLRMFGASIGERVLIRHEVRIHWPWKLTAGDDVWIGEGAWLMNLEAITIGNDVCISQEAALCTGSHAKTSSTFEFDNGPITISDGAWIGLRAVVLRGTTVGPGAVVGAGTIATGTIPSNMVALHRGSGLRYRWPQRPL
jgi:putative colanic acid biosynthesis acetyltransferase WcaF